MPRDMSSDAVDLFGPVDPVPGDTVIHMEYGLGRLEGIEEMEAAGETVTVARLTYADNGRVLVPVGELDRVWRYGNGQGVTLDALDGSGWPKRRDAALVEIAETAKDVKAAHAARLALASEPMHPDPDRLAVVHDSFSHSPTTGQATAFKAVETDLASNRAMDRIVLGDVGFGKTEVIIRAAAFAALSGRQVAVAVPTGVLCDQHTETLRARLEPAGLTVAGYCGDLTEREKREKRKGLASGDIDVVVGTHGLTAKSVRFDRLGLVVIDEEHKFGTRRKQALRALCDGHNRLVTTATPIPKMLTAAEVGLRDLSLLSAPPSNRKPIITDIAGCDPDAIGHALRAEIDAGGQAFLVCPRVADIDAATDLVRAQCPDATCAIAHGKLSKDTVAAAMQDFADGEADVLVSTTLVENGLDIPRANTMIVLEADRFGLAQLHQLRGRIGRSKRQARMLVIPSAKRKLTEDAQHRLTVFAETTTLGAGFEIALTDRNRRGCGDLLGKEQSGHISALGPGYYRYMLRDALTTMHA